MPVRIVNSTDRPAWLRARATGITATDIARAMTTSGRAMVIEEKLWARSSVEDNPYLAHGREREPEIAALINRRYPIVHNTWLFASDTNPRHLATPDGRGPNVVAEIKTAKKPLPATTPRNYRDQIAWQMYVMNADRCLLAWEQHANGVPVDLEPAFRWIERDEARITDLIAAADELLAYLDTERRAA